MDNNESNSIVIAHLMEQISQASLQAIPFSQYMEGCLYHPTDGYYMSACTKIGRQGDFYTSANIHSIMSEMLAVYIKQRAQERKWDSTSITIVEWGAGTGRMALHIHQQLHRMRFTGYEHAIIEVSPYHRYVAKQRLQAEKIAPTWWNKQHFMQQSTQRRIICIANELLDAFPVERIRYYKGCYHQCYVRWDKNQAQFVPVWLPASAKILAWLEHYGIRLLEGQLLDAGIAMSTWLQTVLQQGAEMEWIYIDYGADTNELVAAHRMEGTLMCYYRHRAHHNPWIHVGKQDITAMVDFGICQRIAKQTNTMIQGYMTQKSFLLQQGILSKLQQHTDPDPFSIEARRNRAIRQLLLSDQMSERFQVLLLSRR